jgi:predicted ArsR family transcriptional regulator
MLEDRLQKLLVESRGGATRAQILSAVKTFPRSTHRLAEDLDYTDKTIRHHLDVLVDNDILRGSGNNYGEVYVLTDQARHHWDRIHELIGRTTESIQECEKQVSSRR